MGGVFKKENMKEVPSHSWLVGKIITCRVCLRSYEIEAGDLIQYRLISRSRLRGSTYERQFDLPCGHVHKVPERDAFAPPPELPVLSN